GPHATDLEPRVRVAVVVVKRIWAASLPVRHEEIEEPVIVVITPGGPGRVPAIIDDAASGDLAEGAIAVVVIERVVLAGIVRHEEVKKSIIVIIGPLTQFRLLRIGHDGPGGDFGEGAGAAAAIEEIGTDARHRQIEMPVV